VVKSTGSYAYTYDYRTRRIVRDESAASGARTLLTFSGGTSVQEADASGNVAVEYVRSSDWGGGVGGILYTLRDGDRSYNAYNSRGDVVSVTDDSGAASWQASYEAFGTRTLQVGTNTERQRANTKDEDPTGLLNEGMRYRDLESGMFISRDPLGFVDGPNVYTYVTQNPWSAFDPEGLLKAMDEESQKRLDDLKKDETGKETVRRVEEEEKKFEGKLRAEIANTQGKIDSQRRMKAATNKEVAEIARNIKKGIGKQDPATESIAGILYKERFTNHHIN
jgi:RHS repeat-associated protein